MRIAFFVSPHGFGHAARTAAVIEALTTVDREVRAELFTTVPEWFFADSLSTPFGWYELECDVGLAQRSALEVDLDLTVERLSQFERAQPHRLETAVATLRQLAPAAVVCDISPFGIDAATTVGLPAVLVENFTWDWIYDGYLTDEPRLRSFRDRFAATCERATAWIQTTPACRRRPGATIVPPVSRAARNDCTAIRDRLAIAPDQTMILLTMGGIPWQYRFIETLAKRQEWVFVVPGALETSDAAASREGNPSDTRQELVVEGNLRLLPHRSTFFHPDLVHAADAVIGKLGYSTVAEVHASANRFGFIERPGFAESDRLARFVEQSVPSFPISPEGFVDCAWLDQLPGLLAQPRAAAGRDNGAQQAAAAILSVVR